MAFSCVARHSPSRSLHDSEPDALIWRARQHGAGQHGRDRERESERGAPTLALSRRKSDRPTLMLGVVPSPPPLRPSAATVKSLRILVAVYMAVAVARRSAAISAHPRGLPLLQE